jgi:putative transposase
MTSVAPAPTMDTLPDVIQINPEHLRSHVDTVVRDTVEKTLNDLLQAEAEELCGARRYERSPDRLDTRAGSYRRKLHTKAGEVELKVPRLRSLPFETQIIERYRRRESSVEEALVEMYLAGVSVRRVEDITEALWGARVSASTVSELNQKIAGHIEAWRNRPLAGEHPYVYLDGIWLKRCWGGEVRNVAVLVAMGVRADGFREVLGVMEGAKEDAESWRAFLRHLKERGLEGCGWWSATSAWAWSRRRPSATRRPAGSVVSCTSIGTCSRPRPRARPARWRRCSRRSTPRRTGGRRWPRPRRW